MSQTRNPICCWAASLLASQTEYPMTALRILGEQGKKTKHIVAARQFVRRGLRELDYSYPEIGYALGQDHSTALIAGRG